MSTDPISRIEYLARALKAPRIKDVSTTLENEAIPTLENEAIQSDWMSDHFGRLGSYSSTRG